MSDLKATVSETKKGFHVEGYEKIEYDFTFIDGIFNTKHSDLAKCYKKWGRCLAVMDLNIFNVYGTKMQTYFDHYGLELEVHKTMIGEKAKSVDTLLSIVDYMNKFGIYRKEPMLVVGGGLVTDIAEFGCAAYRRSTNFIRIPTTVIGLIDASVSIKVAVNYGNYKNRLGAYHAPIHTFLDFTFLRTLPAAQIRNGFAELIKISTCAHLPTFNLLDKYCEELIETGFGRTDGASEEIRQAADEINRAGIHEMLKLETPNLHEIGLDRVIAYGHTAECGFLMSSHRDYAKDKDWQYLRLGEFVNTLSFEQRNDGLSELVVHPAWPHMAKKNREDDSYATADLFEPHLSIKNAWRYHSRADSQLTLITGKKFDPAPLEAAIATSTLLKDVLIFGDGKPYPGALLFRSKEARDTSDKELIAELDSMIRTINTGSQSHVRLARNMLVPMPFVDHCLDKSSKGTTIRSKSAEQYAAEIEQAYTKLSLTDGVCVEDDEVASTIKQVVVSIVGKDDDLNDDTDLFSCGVDSVACVQIRHALLQLLPNRPLDLPLTVVEDCGTINRLTDLILSRRHGNHYKEDDQQQLMLHLFEKYATFSDPSLSPKSVEKPSGEVVLLTGATGALGAHILHAYLSSEETIQIFCLIHGTSKYATTERVSKALSSRRLGSLSSKAKVLCTDLSLPSLGLDQSTYKTLLSAVTTIHHVAWAVNFRLRLSSFSSNLAGLRNLINLALSSTHKDPPNLIFCSSVASIANRPTGQAIPETVSSNINDCGPLGYSRSKWVAESICNAAHQQTRLKGRITVMRVGQLSGATDTGIWNMREAYPMMLSQIALTNSLPALNNEALTWLPVDVAAKSFLEVAESMKNGNTSDMRVYHVVNIYRSTQWKDLLGWVKKMQPNLDTIPPTTFVEKLEQLQKNGSKHPAMRLITHWKAAYGEVQETDLARVQKQECEHEPGLEFKMENTYTIAPVLKGVSCIDEAYFRKLWKWCWSKSMVRSRQHH